MQSGVRICAALTNLTHLSLTYKDMTSGPSHMDLGLLSGLRGFHELQLICPGRPHCQPHSASLEAVVGSCMQLTSLGLSIRSTPFDTAALRGLSSSLRSFSLDFGSSEASPKMQGVI